MVLSVYSDFSVGVFSGSKWSFEQNSNSAELILIARMCSIAR
ncbi:hypothetical protein PsAD13_05243 [Pseudovibrio sp. Ad13]|nr:hypothetical protein PsAD13_05243 [Pseudovibrio sp. Ad13]